MSVFGLKKSFRIGFSSLRNSPHEDPMASVHQRSRRSRVLLGLKRLELPIARAPELLDEIGADPFGIEKALELDAGELLNLLFGVVDAALRLNPRPNLAHDLLDVDGVGANIEICHIHLIVLLCSYLSVMCSLPCRELRRFLQTRAQNTD